MLLLGRLLLRLRLRLSVVPLGHSRAKSSKRMSLSIAIVFAWVLKMCIRPSNSGDPNSINCGQRAEAACRPAAPDWQLLLHNLP